jgi:hypothetical protein
VLSDEWEVHGASVTIGRYDVIGGTTDAGYVLARMTAADAHANLAW